MSTLLNSRRREAVGDSDFASQAQHDRYHTQQQQHPSQQQQQQQHSLHSSHLSSHSQPSHDSFLPSLLDRSSYSSVGRTDSLSQLRGDGGGFPSTLSHDFISARDTQPNNH